MNTADGLIVLVLLFGAWQGFRRGFVASLYAFAALALEFIVAGWLKDPVAALAAGYLPFPPETLAPFTFLIALGVAGTVLGLVGAIVVRTIRMVIYRIPLVRPLDKVLGVIPGALQYALIAAGIIVVLGLFVPGTSSLGVELRSSTLAPLVDYVGRLILGSGYVPSPR